jgi:hypothetical protein
MPLGILKGIPSYELYYWHAKITLGLVLTEE